MASLYDLSANTLAGTPMSFADLRGKVLLIVNTASECGFTPQYAGLERLHRDLGPRGLVVLGFPCNQFGEQEPGDSAAIAAFCTGRYGVGFPMFERIDVNGANAHPVFRFLKQAAPGLLGSEAIKWNFTKFLVDRDGRVVERFAPQKTPEAIRPAIERLLDRT